MDCLIIGLTILMSIGVGWSIGANDAANSLGTAVGSRVITLRRAIILIMVFGLLGALLQGHHVTKTIGKGIVALADMDPSLSAKIALVATFASCVWVALATVWKMPVSTSHSVVGAVAGAGLAVSAPVKWEVFGGIFACWVLTPLGAAVIAFVLLHVLQAVFPRVVPEKHSRRVLSFLIIASGCYVAYSWGANDVANATGVLAGAGILPSSISVLLGGLAILLGIITFGHKVMETIGSGITQLLPMMAFAAQLGSAINVHLYTVLGVPVSTSHSIVGAILGVGLARGVKVVNMRIMREIVVCWLATPLFTGVMSYLMMKLLAVWSGI